MQEWAKWIVSDVLHLGGAPSHARAWGGELATAWFESLVTSCFFIHLFCDIHSPTLRKYTTVFPVSMSMSMTCIACFGYTHLLLVPEEQASPSWFVFPVAVLMMDVLYGTTHRLLHIRILYRWIHHTHHSLVVATPESAFFCHPLEHLLCHILPFATICYVLKTSLLQAQALMWLFMSASAWAHTRLKYTLPSIHNTHFSPPSNRADYRPVYGTWPYVFDWVYQWAVYGNVKTKASQALV